MEFLSLQQANSIHEAKMVDFQLTDKGLASDYALAIKSKQEMLREDSGVVVNLMLPVSVTTDGFTY